MEINNGGSQNTNPEKDNGYVTIQKIMEIGQTTSQNREESPRGAYHTTRN